MSVALSRPAPFPRRLSTLPAVGVLGGGQLGCLLADAAAGLGLDVTVVADDPAAPAAHGPHRVIHGPLDARSTLTALARHARLATWESENAELAPLASALPRGLGVVPGLRAMATLQHKLRQKLLLADLGIPAAPHLTWDGHTPPATWASRALAVFGGRAVLKWGRHGYDGRGVLVLRGEAGDHAAATAFVREAALRDLPLYAEALVPYRRELSLVAVRTAAGEVATYPLVITTQDRGVCDRVVGPATAFGVHAGLELAALDAARRVGARLDLVGTFAIEFFEDAHGTLLVNEIAPRVHNTGHWTLDAEVTSQFENHWRAVLGLPLGPTRPAGTFAMLNLLGPAAVDADASELPLPAVPPGARLHWYGKARIRPARKMGHVNLAAADGDTLVSRLAEADRQRAAWQAALESGTRRPEAA